MSRIIYHGGVDKLSTIRASHLTSKQGERPLRSIAFVLVAGASRAWSWAVVEAVEDGFVYFRQVSAREAAQHGSLVTPLPRSA